MKREGRDGENVCMKTVFLLLPLQEGRWCCVCI